MPNRNIFFDHPLPVTTQYGGVDTILNISPGIIIPFSMGTANSLTLNTDASGNSSNVIVIGSGKFSNSAFSLTEGSFNQTANFLYSFIMPYDATLKNIYLSVNYSNSGDYTPPLDYIYTPYVAIATANANNTFTILTETITPISQSFIGGTTYAGNTRITGSRENLGISIPAGTKVAIVAGYTGSPSTSGAFVFRGGLWLS